MIKCASSIIIVIHLIKLSVTVDPLHNKNKRNMKFGYRAKSIRIRPKAEKLDLKDTMHCSDISGKKIEKKAREPN